MAAVSAEDVVEAETDARVASLRLDQLERELSVRESEVQRLMSEVGEFSEADRAAASRDTRLEAASAASPDGNATVVDEALARLDAEERKLASRLERSGHKEMFESFMRRKQELATEEERLTKALEEHEDTLAQIRDRLANPPASFLPDDPVKAQLYVSWKKALAEKEDVLRAARSRRHEMMADLKARHENQIIVLENERREAVGALAETVDQERAKVAQYTEQLAALDEEITESKSALSRFRAEFEQLRVALLVDRMAKSTQVAGLADRRRRLAEEVENFEQAVAEARRRTAAEENKKWEARIAAEREAGGARIAKERAIIDEKIDKVKASLAQQYEAGFQPLLQEAEERHMQELQRVVELKRTLEEKEAELQAAHAAARATAMDATGFEGDGEPEPEDVPEETLREFEKLRAGVVSLWEQLDVPPDDVMAFLSECDLLAPYHPKVLDLYQTMHKELTGRATPDGADTAPPLYPPEAALPSYSYSAGDGGASLQPSPIRSATDPPPSSAYVDAGVSAAAAAMAAAPPPPPPPYAAVAKPSVATPVGSRAASRTPTAAAAVAAGGGGGSASRSRPRSAAGSKGRSRGGPTSGMKSRAALYDTYKSDVTSRLYPGSTPSARVKALRAKSQRSTRSDWGAGGSSKPGRRR